MVMLFKITAYIRTPPNRQVRANLDSEPPYSQIEYYSDNNMVEGHMEALHKAGYDVLSVTSKPGVPNIEEGNDGNQPDILTD
jgi:hypothetical protein